MTSSNNWVRRSINKGIALPLVNAQLCFNESTAPASDKLRKELQAKIKIDSGNHQET